MEDAGDDVEVHDMMALQGKAMTASARRLLSAEDVSRPITKFLFSFEPRPLRSTKLWPACARRC